MRLRSLDQQSGEGGSSVGPDVLIVHDLAHIAQILDLCSQGVEGTEGVSPYTGSDTSTCLAALRSSAKMNHDIHAGGTLLNLRLNQDLLATKRGRANLGAMLQAYFALGGFHVQARRTYFVMC